jgi:hypothetical protein
MAMDNSAGGGGSQVPEPQQPGIIQTTLTKLQSGVDAVVPPEKRTEYWEKFKAFSVAHPKVTVSHLIALHIC